MIVLHLLLKDHPEDSGDGIVGALQQQTIGIVLIMEEMVEYAITYQVAMCEEIAHSVLLYCNS